MQHYPAVIKQAAQAKIEDVLLALMDFLASYSLKLYNNGLTPADRHILLAHGGKAFSEYIERSYRPDSYDWDVKIVAENSITIPELDNLSRRVVTELARLMSLKLDKILTLGYTIHRAIDIVKDLDGFGEPRLRNLQPENIRIRAFPGQRQAAAGGTVSYVCLCVVLDRPYNILTIFETWPVQDNQATLAGYFRAIQSCVKLPRHILDRKRYLASYDYVKQNIRTMITTPSYPKKDKARQRLQIMNNAEASGQLICSIQERPDCRARTVFDFTNGQAWFVPTITLSEAHKARDRNLLAGPGLSVLRDYTGNLYRSVNGLLLTRAFYNLSDQQILGKYGWPANTQAKIRQLDDLFDRISNNPLTYDIVLYRNTAYVDFSVDPQDQEVVVNLYKLRPGTVINNISYLSTTYSNQNSSLAGFVEDSQFRGCLFIIKARSSAGMIVIDQLSQVQSEKEVLLDRRGKLRVTNVSYKYIVEPCDTKSNMLERLVIEADYYPPGTLADPGIDSIIFADYMPRYTDTDRYDMLDLADVDLYNKLGLTSFDRRSSLGVLYHLKELHDHRIPEQPGTIRLDTKIGVIHVNRRLHDLSIESIAQPRQSKKWMIVAAVIIAIIIVLAIVLPLVLREHNVSRPVPALSAISPAGLSRSSESRLVLQ